ncbi:MAG: hypothetical protein LBU86_01865 [Oscillospiraceae bacterium]|jgi:hypothetical protein|nr:hypothetical protein [Oscillospiraceae bacterium]
MARRTFGAERKRRGSYLRQIALPLAAFALMAVFFYRGMSSVDENAASERLAMADRAVRRAVAQCYAVEGQYPASLRYLKENYGLMVDEGSYVVKIDFAGGNILPNITVMPRYF